MVQLGAAALVLGVIFPLVNSTPVLSLNSSIVARYDEKSIHQEYYYQTFSSENDALNFIGVGGSDGNRYSLLMRNSDPDTLVVSAFFTVPERLEVKLLIAPGNWGIIKNIPKGQSRRIGVFPGCDSKGNNCLPRFDITSLFEYTDGGDRENVAASINLSIVDGYNTGLKVSFPGGRTDWETDCPSLSVSIPKEDLRKACPAKQLIQHFQGQNEYLACVSACKSALPADYNKLCCEGEWKYPHEKCGPSFQELRPWADDAYLWPHDDSRSMRNCRFGGIVKLEFGGNMKSSAGGSDRPVPTITVDPTPIPTLTQSSIQVPTTTATLPSAGTVGHWKQCGGHGYSGPTECESGLTCWGNEWWKDCRYV